MDLENSDSFAPSQNLENVLLDYPPESLDQLLSSFSNHALISTLSMSDVSHSKHVKVLIQHLVVRAMPEEEMHTWERTCCQTLAFSVKHQRPMEFVDLLLKEAKPLLTQAHIDILLAEIYDSEVALGVLQHPLLSEGIFERLPLRRSPSDPPVDPVDPKLILEGVCWWPEIMNGSVLRHLSSTLTPKEAVHALLASLARKEKNMGFPDIYSNSMSFWSEQSLEKPEAWWKDVVAYTHTLSSEDQDLLRKLPAEWLACYEKQDLSMSIKTPKRSSPKSRKM